MKCKNCGHGIQEYPDGHYHQNAGDGTKDCQFIDEFDDPFCGCTNPQPKEVDECSD